MLIGITVVSALVAAVMSVVAWRFARAERQRSNARVAALSADLQESDLELRPARVAPRELFSDGRIPVGIGGETPSSGPPGRLAAVVGVGIFAVGVAAAVVVVTGRSGGPVGDAAVGAAAPPAAPRPAAANLAPLELVALGHERDGDRMTVRGVVRNPRGAGSLDQLAVVVFLFDRDGGFLASGRAALDAPRLAPGIESTFMVIAPNATDVGRYRVSFRSREQIVPHVDRRDPGPVAQLK